MNEDILGFLKKLAPAESQEQLESTARELEELARRLGTVLRGLDTLAQHELLGRFRCWTLATLVDAEGKPLKQKLPKELIDWANGQIDMEEIRAGLKEIETTGGFELKDFIHELEKEAGLSE